MLPNIEEFQEANGIMNEPAVLLVDNCSAHTYLDVVALLSRRRVKTMTFLPHTSGIFQMLNLVFFGVFKRIKKYLSTDWSLRVLENHAVPMFKAC
jgi:hypothetical protein